MPRATSPRRPSSLRSAKRNTPTAGLGQAPVCRCCACSTSRERWTIGIRPSPIRLRADGRSSSSRTQVSAGQAARCRRRWPAWPHMPLRLSMVSGSRLATFWAIRSVAWSRSRWRWSARRPSVGRSEASGICRSAAALLRADGNEPEGRKGLHRQTHATRPGS